MVNYFVMMLRSLFSDKEYFSNLVRLGLPIAIQNLIWGFSQPLAGMIADRMNDPAGLAATAAAAQATGKPDAARLLANLAEAIAEGVSLEQFRSSSA